MVSARNQRIHAKIVKKACKNDFKVTYMTFNMFKRLQSGELIYNKMQAFRTFYITKRNI